MLSILRPDPWLLVAAVFLDLIVGDPVYRAHPVRLIGATVIRLEHALCSIKLDAYGGGICLFLLVAVIWCGGISIVTGILGMLGGESVLGFAAHLFLLYSFLALRDLVKHCWNVETECRRKDLGAAREAISRLVGRDTNQMDFAACRRAAIESLSENITDGFISPLFWYLIAGLPGIAIFKVASTLDSMVGYKNDRYLRFGWCSARVDDVMNWLPARITWLLIALVSLVIPGCSFRKALTVGWRQHDLLPGPNSGWSEAAAAGAIQRRLVGEVRVSGRLVADVWIGVVQDPPAGTSADMCRAIAMITITGLVAAGVVITYLALRC